MLLELILATIVTSGSAAEQEPGVDAEAAGPIAVRARFLEEVRACGVTPAFEPDLRMETSSAIITYRWEPRAVLIARWDELPEAFQGLVAQWAASAAPTETPREFFGNTFQDTGVAHEMGHWLQHQAGRHLTLSRWDAEVEANRIGIAFAELRDGPEATARRAERFGWLLQMPYAAPEGVDIEENFNTNYPALANDPVAYGWYQGAIIRAALDERTQGDFCDLVRLNAPPPTAE